MIVASSTALPLHLAWALEALPLGLALALEAFASLASSGVGRRDVAGFTGCAGVEVDEHALDEVAGFTGRAGAEVDEHAAGNADSHKAVQPRW